MPEKVINTKSCTQLFLTRLFIAFADYNIPFDRFMAYGFFTYLVIM